MSFSWSKKKPTPESSLNRSEVQKEFQVCAWRDDVWDKIPLWVLVGALQPTNMAYTPEFKQRLEGPKMMGLGKGATPALNMAIFWYLC